jgi:hypothetical protein
VESQDPFEPVASILRTLLGDVSLLRVELKLFCAGRRIDEDIENRSITDLVLLAKEIEAYRR